MLLSDWPVLTRDSSNLVSGDGLGLLGVDVFHDWESSGGPRGRFGRLGDVFCLPNVRNVHFDLPIVENVHPGAGFALPIVDFVHGHPVWTPNRRKRPRARRAPTIRASARGAELIPTPPNRQTPAVRTVPVTAAGLFSHPFGAEHLAVCKTPGQKPGICLVL